MSHEVYDRGLKNSGYSHKKNPGGLDTVQAIYLACCDYFITGDKPQYNVLISIVRWGHKKRHVLLYKDFKELLLNPCHYEER